jgi:predicted restriction endonuclease
MHVSDAFARPAHFDGLNIRKTFWGCNSHHHYFLFDRAIPGISPDQKVLAFVATVNNPAHNPSREQRHPLAVNT